MSRSSAALAAALLALAGCRTSQSSAPAGLSAARPIRLEQERAWRVVEGDTLLGLVVQYGSTPQPDQPRSSYFSVQNALQQELGRIDGLGRAWRFEPHRSEARWVATGTVIEGVRAILETGVNAVLDPAWVGESPDENG